MTDQPLVELDPTSTDPPYEQVREQLRARVLSGDLSPGTRLPPVRTLAQDLGLAPGTVARAYRELEGLGVIETRGRAGSVVLGDGAEQAARQAAHDFVEQMRALGLDEYAAIRLVQNAFT